MQSRDTPSMLSFYIKMDLYKITTLMLYFSAISYNDQFQCKGSRYWISPRPGIAIQPVICNFLSISCAFCMSISYHYHHHSVSAVISLLYLRNLVYNDSNQSMIVLLYSLLIVDAYDVSMPTIVLANAKLPLRCPSMSWINMPIHLPIYQLVDH